MLLRRVWVVTFLILCSKSVVLAEDLEHTFITLSSQKRAGVIPIEFWPKWTHDGLPPDQMPIVAGTGFLLNHEGYFLTAAHVLQGLQTGDSSFNFDRQGNYQAIFWGHSKDANSSTTRSFHVIEKDEQHDIALCKIDQFKIYYGKPPIKNYDFDFPVATFRLGASIPPVGSFVSAIGFPLGSWFPTTQFGTLATTETVNPTIGRVPAGQNKLIQVAISGNKGNSGSPVIDVHTGDVVGIIVQAVPAQLFTPENLNLPFAQSSGLMLAVPPEWIQPLLARHHVTTESISATKAKVL